MLGKALQKTIAICWLGSLAVSVAGLIIYSACTSSTESLIQFGIFLGIVGGFILTFWSLSKVLEH